MRLGSSQFCTAMQGRLEHGLKLGRVVATRSGRFGVKPGNLPVQKNKHFLWTKRLIGYINSIGCGSLQCCCFLRAAVFRPLAVGFWKRRHKVGARGKPRLYTKAC